MSNAPGGFGRRRGPARLGRRTIGRTRSRRSPRTAHEHEEEYFCIDGASGRTGMTVPTRFLTRNAEKRQFAWVVHTPG